MRAPNDGRDEDRWPQGSGSSSVDRETTRAFTRPGAEDSAQGFDRGPGPDDLATRAFDREGFSTEERPSGFTRRFVRGRVAGRGKNLGEEPARDEAVAAPAGRWRQGPASDDRGHHPDLGEGGWQLAPDAHQQPDRSAEQGARPAADHTRVDPRPSGATAAYGPGAGPVEPGATRAFDRDDFLDRDGFDHDEYGRDEYGRGGFFDRDDHGPGDFDLDDRGRREPPSHRPRRRKKRRFRLRWLITFLIVLVLAIPPGTWGWVWYTARQDDRDPSDAIIVLGASQYNGVPSPVFEARLQHAQNLYQQGVAPMIITVGGKQPDDAYTEAAAGRDWLVEVGIPADQIVAVEEGADTLQSLVAVAEVYDQEAWETGILVSDPWHSLRAKRMAADFGIEAGTSPARSGPAVIERSTQLWYITRETASLWYYWIFNDSSDIRVNAA